MVRAVVAVKSPTPIAPEVARPGDLFRRRRDLDVGEVLLREEDRDEDRFGPRSAPVDTLDIETFRATVGCLYTKFKLSPPWSLPEAAAAWMSDGITSSHCLAEIEKHLRAHAADVRSGSGDAGFRYLDEIIRYEWNKAHPSAKVPKALRPRARFVKKVEVSRITENDWLGNYFD